LSFPYTSR